MSATLVAFGTAGLAQAAVKVGTVDMQRALRSVKRGKNAQAKLEKDLGAEKTKLEKDQEKFQKDAQAFQQKAEALSEKARAEQGGALQQRMVDIQQRAQKFQMDAQRRQAEAIEPIVKGLREATTRVGSKRKMDLVIDDTGEAILYAEDKTDLTEEVIKAYDEKNP
ncbi:MAG TPA: OmpH family outer membrane protein [Bdellovibrionota bacterium]|nr:OmpH family outer membrane protein [Bdellovibrionota bacterium]